MVTSSLNMYDSLGEIEWCERGVPLRPYSGVVADVNDDINVSFPPRLFPPWYDPIIHAKKCSFA